MKRIHQSRRPATAKSAPRDVMANAPSDDSRSHMSKLQSQMRSRLSLGDPDPVSTIPRYTAATGKSTSESILANRYGTRGSCNGLVVGGATTYKRGMTVPESKSTPTSSNHSTGSARRKDLGVHLPAENRSWTVVNKLKWRRVNQCT